MEYGHGQGVFWAERGLRYVVRLYIHTGKYLAV